MALRAMTPGGMYAIALQAPPGTTGSLCYSADVGTPGELYNEGIAYPMLDAAFQTYIRLGMPHGCIAGQLSRVDS